MVIFFFLTAEAETFGWLGLLFLLLLFELLYLHQFELLYLFLLVKLLVLEAVVFGHEGGWFDLVVLIKLLLFFEFVSDTAVVLPREVDLLGDLLCNW